MQKICNIFWHDRGKWGKFFSIILVLALARTLYMVGFSIIDPSGFAEYRAEQEAADKARADKYAADKKAEEMADQAEIDKANEQAEWEKLRGFHCLSKWDGSHIQTVNRLKDALRDPGSFEHIETKIGAHTNGVHRLTMRYRSRNGFGGMAVGNIVASIDNESCDVLEIIPEK